MKSKLEHRLTWRLQEIADLTGLKYRWLFERVKTGELKAKKIGGVILVQDSDLRRFLGMEI